MARVVTQLDVGRAPSGAQARRNADVESRLAQWLVFKPVGNAVGVVAVEALGDESIEAPGAARFILQANARAVQVGVVALVQVERVEAARGLRAAVGRALLAPGVADRGAAGHERVEVRVALRRDRAGREGER